MKKWLMVLVPLIILGTLIGWRLREKRAAETEEAGPRMRGGPASVEMTLPSRRDVMKTYQATGSIESIREVKLSPKISGRIEYLAVREGDRVTPGQVLARLDQSEVLAQVRQQQANLAEAKARLAQAQLNQFPVDAAVRTQIRQQEAALASAEDELRQAQHTRVAQLDAIAASLDDAKGKVENAAATLASAEADLRQAETTRIAQLEASKADVENARTRIETAVAAVANAAAQVKSAQANLENATAKYERIHALYLKGYVAAQDVDDAKTAVRVQQSGVETAKGQQQSATAALASAQAQMRATEQQATITRAKVDADIESARARVTQMKAAVESAKAQQRSAEQQAKITRVKADGDVTSAQTRVTQAKAALEYARANAKSSPAFEQNLEALRAGIAAEQASLDSIRVKLLDTEIRSPLSGVVSARAQEVGGLSSPGQAILTVQATNSIWVTIAAPADVCRRLHLNQPAQVEFDELDLRVSGRIAQINPAADPQSRQYTVRVILDNRDGLYTPGMFARVTLVTEEVKQALAVPNEAIRLNGDSSAFVYAVGTDNTVRQRPVTLGISDGNWTAIQSGLQSGERVVTMSATRLSDGQQVREAGAGRSGRPDGQGRPGGGAEGRPDGNQARPDRSGHEAGSGQAPRGPRRGQ
ncbi:MAG: Efflux pump periplasmic linker BepF [bacterium ADurb.Bin429]|nr:MAG: Efflux pump periplasmic linker BepF [bacterium ADurb.Bin429]